MDDKKVDLCGTEPFNIQAKNYGSFSSAKVIQTLKEMPNDSNYNICHLKITNKGEIVAMSKSDFYEILKMMKKEELI
jgi:roadblock/LC7 domain-containing protein